MEVSKESSGGLSMPSTEPSALPADPSRDRPERTAEYTRGFLLTIAGSGVSLATLAYLFWLSRMIHLRHVGALQAFLAVAGAVVGVTLIALGLVVTRRAVAKMQFIACPKCGMRSSWNSKACPRCGAALAPAPTAGPTLNSGTT